MAMKTLPHVFACVLGLSSALVGVSNSQRGNLGFPGSGGISCIGLCGTTHTFTSFPNGATITAAGFTDSTFATPVQMFGKTLLGDENGLGLINDPAPGESEIAGTSLIRIAMSAGLSAPVSFTMNSTTAGESWLVQGSNSAGNHGLREHFGGERRACAYDPVLQFLHLQCRKRECLARPNFGRSRSDRRRRTAGPNSRLWWSYRPGATPSSPGNCLTRSWGLGSRTKRSVLARQHAFLL